MNSDLMCKCLDLNDLIKKTKQYQELIDAEKQMESSDEVSLLAYKKDMIIMEFEDAISHYGKNSNETLQAEKKLSEATFNLNNHELVKTYKQKLNALNELYLEIEKALFKGIKDEVC